MREAVRFSADVQDGEIPGIVSVRRAQRLLEANHLKKIWKNFRKGIDKLAGLWYNIYVGWGFDPRKNGADGSGMSRKQFSNGGNDMTYIRKIDGRWYAYSGDRQRGQVYSIGRDNPSEGGRWFARWTDNGIKYVASASPSRKAAYEKARRYGEYGGEV